MGTSWIPTSPRLLRDSGRVDFLPGPGVSALDHQVGGRLSDEWLPEWTECAVKAADGFDNDTTRIVEATG